MISTNNARRATLLAAAVCAIPSLTAYAGYSDAVVGQSPLFYWRLNDAANGAVAAAVDNSATADNSASTTVTLVNQSGAPALTPAGGFAGFESGNTWFSFAGVAAGDFIATLTNPKDVQSNALGSVSNWINTTDLAGAGTFSNLYRVDQGATGALYTFIDSAGKFGLRVSQGSGEPLILADIRTTNSYANGGWHHVAATWDQANNTATIFVDGGSLAGGETVTGVYATGTATFVSSGRHQFGKGTAIANQFTGSADELAIWTTLLTPEQIQAQYAAAFATGGSSAQWNIDADGDWHTATSWNPQTIPNAAGAQAELAGVITAPRTISLSASATVGTLIFNNASGYTVGSGGGSSLVLDASGTAAINVTAGSHVIAAPVTLNDDLAITVAGAADALSLTGAVTATGKNITKSGTGAVRFENLRASGLSVTAGSVKISAKGAANSAGGTSVVQSLSIAAGASVDLTNNSMVIDYTGPVGTLVDDVRQHLQSGRLDTTSVSPAATSLGYADNNSATPATSFGGQTVDATSVLIKYTYAGDSNLDGQVDITDLAALATAWQTAGVWVSGDFDYSGFIDITDLAALATNWQAGVGAPLSITFEQALASVGLGGVAVPEPAVLGLLGSVALLVRRRR